MLFDDGQALVRTAVVGVAAYVALVAMLRISGKRTLAKLNAFDFVVTIALGSTLSAVLLDRSVSLAQGVLALAVLIGLQLAITWTSVRFKRLRTIVTGEPRTVLRNGAFIEEAMKAVRVTEEEVRAAVRGAGHLDVAGIEAVVLETDGSFSVVPRAAARH